MKVLYILNKFKLQEINLNNTPFVELVYVEAIEELKSLEQRIKELEYNFSCILDHATGGRASKTNIDKDIAYKLIDENINFWVNSAVEELETPMTCEGCKWNEFEGYSPDKKCEHCQRGLFDYYEPKDTV